MNQVYNELRRTFNGLPRNIGISQNMHAELDVMIMQERQTPLHNARKHCTSLLADLTKCNAYVNRTRESENCVKRIKYHMKAIRVARDLDDYIQEREYQDLRKRLEAKEAEEATTFNIDDCPCCYEAITNYNIIVLECDHIVCKPCIAKIKNINNACPICREPI